MASRNKIERYAGARGLRVEFFDKADIGFTNIGYHAILKDNPSELEMMYHLDIADKQGAYVVHFYCKDYNFDEDRPMDNLIDMEHYRRIKYMRRLK